MKPARIVFPGFWFGESNLQDAVELARRGVGGFCVYGGTAQQTRDFTLRMNEASPYGRLLSCPDIDEDLSEIIPTRRPCLPIFPYSSFLPRKTAPTAKAICWRGWPAAWGWTGCSPR